MQALCFVSGVEERAICSSRSLDLFLVSICFESGFDGEGLCFAVDCLALDGVLPTSLKAATGSARASSSIVDKVGLMRLLGHFHLKLDWVLARVSTGPNLRGIRFAFWALLMLRAGLPGLSLMGIQVKVWSGCGTKFGSG